jgi:hypothetical protein
MKVYGWIVAFLAVLALAGIAFVLAPHSHPVRDCAGRVGMLKGPHGAPMECVCIRGVMASCFEPGP